MIEQLENEKTCTKCAATKPLSAFALRKDRPGGAAHKSECRACTTAYHRSREARIRAGIGPTKLASLPFQPHADAHRAWQQADRSMRAHPAQNLSARIAA